jgi:hypothetical protein
MLADVARSLGYALISVRRFLKQVGYFRSYTHNGKWYTLHDSPQFNREGLWHHRDIGFSKHGSLTATIDHLVGRSPDGLSARELAQKLQHPCHAVLTHLHQDGVLDRIKVGGEFRYLAKEASLNRQQREHAAAATPLSSSSSLGTQAAVLVLVEYVKHPGRSFEELATHLRQQGQLAVGAESIRRFFAEHDLKKTPEPPTPGP